MNTLNLHDVDKTEITPVRNLSEDMVEGLFVRDINIHMKDGSVIQITLYGKENADVTITSNI